MQHFYIIPILLICGLLLGRLQELATLIPALAPGVWRLEPAHFFTPTGYRLIVLVLALLPLGYFASIGVSAYQLSRGNMFAAQNMFDEANRAFVLAQRFWSDSDAPLIARAELYRVVLARDGRDDEQRRALFQGGEELLAQAERLNPLRPDVFTFRAELYWQAPLLAGSGWDTKVAANYRHALVLDPRYFRARHGYALFLLAQAQEKEVGRVLEEGMRYYYSNRIEIMPYFNLTAWLRDRAGDHTGGAVLRQRMEEYAQGLVRQRDATNVSR